MTSLYQTLSEILDSGNILPVVTVHGRFQPPVHRNHHETYIKNAFRIAKYVRFLITNPYRNETTQHA